MDVIETREDGRLVLAPKGPIDSATAPELERIVLPRIAAGDAILVFDMAQVPYMSSAGLRVLLMAAKRAGAAGGRIVCCGLTANVARIFEISGFRAVVGICGSAGEALAMAGRGNEGGQE